MVSVSMDGLRKNATASVNDLSRTIKKVLEEIDDEDLAAELIEKFNDTASMVGCFNCIYDDKNETDFNNLSDLKIEKIEDEEG